MTETKKQHYVPQFLLRHFDANGSERLWVLDKQEGRIYQSRILDIAHENRYNEVALDDDRIELHEDRFTRIEDGAAPVIAKLVNGLPLASLGATEKAWLCYFVLNQFLRTPAYRAMTRTLYSRLNAIESDIRSRVGVPPAAVPTDEEAKRDSLNLSFALPKQLAAHVLSKTWLLHKAHRSCSFCISDAPVAMFNDIGRNIGFAVARSRVLLPLSPHAVLGCYCPALTAREITQNWQSAHLVGTNARLPCAPTQMGLFNGLQVIHANRFVYSSDGDFDFALKLLEEYPDYRSPPPLVEISRNDSRLERGTE